MLVTLPNVILLLRDTIDSKERYLKSLEDTKLPSSVGYDASAIADRLVHQATIGFVRVNIDELKKIVADLEQVQ
jgi:hypothetical protein